MDKYIKSYSNFRQYEPPKKRGLLDLFKKKKKDSYSSRILSVPSYSSTARPSFSRPAVKKNYRSKIILSLLGAVILSWVILMIYLPYFRIQKIEFEGLKIIDKNEINTYLTDKYLKGGFLPHNNYFLIDEAKIEEDIAAKYSIDSVKAVKVFPGVINIVIAEKITTIIYDNEYSYSLVDKEGNVIKIIDQYSQFPISATSTSSSEDAILTITGADSSTSTTSTEPAINIHRPDYNKLHHDYGEIPIVLDQRKLPIAEKQTNILTPNLITSIIEWQKAIKDEGIGDIRYFETDNPPAGFKVFLNKNWHLLIQPSNSLTEQINNLQTILTNKEINPAEYIDLRYGERVFWK